jgi:hypothetical protein
MVRPSGFRLAASLLGTELRGRIGGVDSATHRKTVPVGLGLTRYGREDDKANHERDNDNDGARCEKQRVSSSLRSCDAAENREQAGPDWVSAVCGVRRLRFGHFPWFTPSQKLQRFFW